MAQDVWLHLTGHWRLLDLGLWSSFHRRRHLLLIALLVPAPRIRYLDLSVLLLGFLEALEKLQVVRQPHLDVHGLVLACNDETAQELLHIARRLELLGSRKRVTHLAPPVHFPLTLQLCGRPIPNVGLTLRAHAGDPRSEDALDLPCSRSHAHIKLQLLYYLPQLSELQLHDGVIAVDLP